MGAIWIYPFFNVATRCFWSCTHPSGDCDVRGFSSTFLSGHPTLLQSYVPTHTHIHRHSSIGHYLLASVLNWKLVKNLNTHSAKNCMMHIVDSLDVFLMSWTFYSLGTPSLLFLGHIILLPRKQNISERSENFEVLGGRRLTLCWLTARPRHNWKYYKGMKLWNTMMQS